VSRVPVVVAESVWNYVRGLAPVPRRKCKAALLALPAGDTKELEGDYAGLHRLRVGSIRFIYRYHDGRIEVFYAEQRRLVYDLLAAHIARLFNTDPSG
jgi:mRNA-degrading endonuclease RelE of RelBE toxin-antitoxin system